MAYYGDREERITETEQYSNNYDRGYGYGEDRRNPREEERYTETTYYSNDNDRPPPPQVPYPWRPEWDARERRYIFVNEQNGERTWDYPGGYGGGGYERREEVITEEQRGYGEQQRRQGGGHSGLMYGAMGAAAGLAGGAFLMHESGNIENDYERDKYRVENDVEDFPENTARWGGEKVQEVEDIPQDVEQGFDRFGRRIENGFDDVVDAPEEVSGWAGRKVGDVERYDDNVGNAYDEGRDERRYEDNDRW
ncbi:hypothetical protein LTR35_009571 [Friedmanniomyces endolithicus]|uniref:WW domain-containing protein n=1 Tax=Friedmanniomyces endolithicus TaxID=329885 RepID=A0AAN6FRX4_9PEZI|nr:hypothetical protein LTR35_009571 [Friedmanniomyces endolithicus]KAK0301222.1 hypothetical protein LTS00_000371 [Friedmanniomyces endolithicus]KAK0321186.1 hypothetical protein LTR82_007638 [Friedmanniomyces endolithicus]KAK0983939.1 hypothetical protein LTR54_014231 [Friedmanniomyces endolithicus]